MLAVGHEVTIAAGRVETTDAPCTAVTVRGLAKPVASTARLGRLAPLLAAADVVHVQNVMNPTALAQLVATQRAVVTVQDHRVFCPGPGRTLPDGLVCAAPMGDDICEICLPERDYRARVLALTATRRDALRGAHLVVLSRYMAAELEAAGLSGAHVIPPPVTLGPPRREPGRAFLLAGRLVGHKAPDLALSAWRAAGAPLPLRVVGNGTVPDAGGPAFTRLAHVPRAALAGLMRTARALLLPGRWQEPFGMVGLEALAQGCPVVARHSGGVADWATAGVLRAQTPRQMSDAIRRLADDPGFALALGQAGQAAAARWPSASALRHRLEAVYAAAMSRSA